MGTTRAVPGGVIARIVAVLTLGMLVAAPGRFVAESRGAGRTVVIRMTDDMRFIPEHPTVAPGDTVVWINEGKMPHTSTDTPGTAAVPEHNVLPAGAEPWDSGLLNAGERYTRVFTVAGDYTYLCWLHEALGMVGKLTVRGGGRAVGR